MEQTSEGGMIQHHNRGYILHVKNGVCEIFADGDLKLGASRNIEINAGGRLDIQSGSVMNLYGSKVAITAEGDAIDLVAAGKVAIASAKTGVSIMSVDPIYVQSKAGINVKAGKGIGIASSGGDVGIKANNLKLKGDKIHLNSPGEDPDDVPDSLAAVMADVPMEKNKLGIVNPGAIDDSGIGMSADMIDEGTSLA